MILLFGQAFPHKFPKMTVGICWDVQIFLWVRPPGVVGALVPTCFQQALCSCIFEKFDFVLKCAYHLFGVLGCSSLPCLRGFGGWHRGVAGCALTVMVKDGRY